MYRPCRRKKVPSLPVVEEIIHRPVPLWKNVCTVPSRRAKKDVPSRPVVTILFTVPSRSENFYLPSRPVVKCFTYRPVPSWQILFTVPSHHETKRVIVLYRPVPSKKFTPTVPSRPIQATIIFIVLPSRPVPFSLSPPKKTCQNSTVPSRLEYYQPWKALVFLDFFVIWIESNFPRPKTEMPSWLFIFWPLRSKLNSIQFKRLIFFFFPFVQTGPYRISDTRVFAENLVGLGFL